ncbi:hypothetical protein J4460_00340 [Candidatus Woesearchaeota archaeon]|nr:MAG: hypothetical protein QS99_C0002G0120 [archaeon GW2011_AR4]MBS3129098.1 hypothetical protein [Candidatus Woesearchaeota archaeon]HIH37830.1 hypothetical protein [Candidatus Woesearchaeota archaeon]HIH49276.1 hypothetical protein [Candidatus Woesearchaeota archaeon]HIJ03955.1 hypothetical protein [Candidatus Woesearchaeota archaeon]
MKGQVQTQVFFYILGLIIMSLILIIGYRGIKSIGSQAEQAKVISFEKDMYNAIKAMKGDVGSTRTEVFYPPAGIEYICFYGPTASSPPIDSYYLPPMVKSTIQSGAKDNMFVMKRVTVDASGNINGGTIEHQTNVGEIIVNDITKVCHKVAGGQVNIKLEGKGNKVMIQDPVS